MPGILCPSPVVSRGSVGWRRTRGFPFGPRPVPWFYFNTQIIGGLNPEPLPCSVPAQPGLGAALAAEILPFSPKDALLAGGGRSAPLRQPRDPCGSPGAGSGNTGNAGAQANRTQRVLSARGPEMLGAGWKTTFNSCISRERCGISTQAGFLHFRAFWAHIFPLSEKRLLENIIRSKLSSNSPSNYILIKKRTSWAVSDLGTLHFKSVLIIVLIA